MNPGLIPTRVDMLRLLPIGTIGAEIGVCRGEFSAEILENVNGLKRLHLVDAWRHIGGDYEHDPENVDDGGHEERERIVRDRFANDQRVRIHKSLSHEFLANEHWLDWVYLDADHSRESVIRDLLACHHAGVRFILGHDYREDGRSAEMRFGVVEAVTDFCQKYGYLMRYLTQDEWPSYWLEKE